MPAPSLLLPLLGGQQEAGGEEAGGEAGGEPGGEAGGGEAGGGEAGGGEAGGEGRTDVREMAKTERMILKAVDFHLRTCTAATFLHYFNQVRTLIL